MSDVLDRLSLSTCWSSSRHTDGYAMIQEIVDLGFKCVELSHGIRISLVPGILKAINEGLVEISSVHNFCPLPPGVLHAAPNVFKPSAANSREQALWERHTKQTLDFSVKVGAKRVVMHSGSANFLFRSPHKRLEQWIEESDLKAAELSENDVFVNFRDHAMKRIQRASKAAMHRIKERFKQAVEWADERSVQLCIENREGLAEMPLDQEMRDFIDELSAPKQIGYWHDTGHAQIKHQYGLLDHREHLSALSERLVGFHLHDTTDSGADHQLIGSGTVDFKMIAEFIRPEHTLVLELSPQLSAEEVVQSRSYIGALLQ